MQDFEPAGYKNFTNVKMHLAWSQESNEISSACLSSVYDTFPGWVARLTVILRPVQSSLVELNWDWPNVLSLAKQSFFPYYA